jgi:hypothetical protein
MPQLRLHDPVTVREAATASNIGSYQNKESSGNRPELLIKFLTYLPFYPF